MKIDTRKLAISAMLICLDVLFTRVLAINTPLMKVGFGFAAVAVSGLLYGPIWAMLTAAIGDFVGAVLLPVGAFFPGFTFTAALTGLIFGLCMYNRGEKIIWPVLAALLNCFFVTLVANTALIMWISGNDYGVLFTARSVQFFVMFPIQSAVLIWLSRSRVIKLIKDRYL